jgi:WD40 repeat protein
MLSADGQLVFTLADDRNGRVWSAQGKVEAQFHLPEPVWYGVFSPAADRLLTIPIEKFPPRLWTPRGEEVGGLRGHEERVPVARFSPEGDRIVTASKDKTARLWDRDGHPWRMLEHPDEVTAATLLPRGQGAVTGCRDGTVRHWDADGQLRAVIAGHARTVWRVEGSKEGDWIATGSEDTTVRLWPLGCDALLAIARERACRDFTAEERARYARVLAK